MPATISLVFLMIRVDIDSGYGIAFTVLGMVHYIM